MQGVFVIMNIAMGILTGAMGAGWVKHMDKEQVFCTSVKFRRNIMLVCAAAFCLCMPIRSMKMDAGQWCMLITLCIFAMVFVPSAFLDSSTGSFYLFPVLCALVAQILVLVCAHISGYVHFTGDFVLHIVGGAAAIFLLSLCCYSKGDGLLFLIALLGQCIFYREYFLFSFFGCFGVSCILFVCRYMKAFIKEKNKNGSRYPFGGSIAGGYFLIMLYAFLCIFEGQL